MHILARISLASLACLGTIATAKAGDQDKRDYLDLLARCRVAIEAVAPLDAAGLDDLGIMSEFVPPLAVKVEGLDLFSGERLTRRWAAQGDRFVVTEEEYVASADSVRRSCSLSLAEGGAAITPEEERAFADAFSNDQAFDSLSYQEKTTPYPEGLTFRFSTLLELESTAENANGCLVEGSLAIDNSLVPYFSASYMEKHGACGGPSILREVAPSSGS